MTNVIVSSKDQIAIPNEVWEALKLKAGTENSRIWRTMQGMVKSGPSLTKALEEDRAAEHAHYDARIKQGR